MKKILLLIVGLGSFWCNASDIPLAITNIAIKPFGCGSSVVAFAEVSVTVEGGDSEAPFVYRFTNTSAQPSITDTILQNCGLGLDCRKITFPINGLFSPGLIPFTLQVFVQNGNESVTAFVPVRGPEPLTIERIIVTNPACGGDLGSIELVPRGTFPGRYSIDGVNNGTSPIFENLLARETPYIITATPVNGCPALTFRIPVSGPAPLRATTESQPVTCFGIANGEVEVTNITGGFPPYEVALDNGPFQPFVSPSVIFSNVAAGQHVLTIRDANGCFESQSINPVGSPDQLVALTDVTDVTCSGGSDGSITIRAIGGGVPPYLFAFNGDGFRPFTGAVTFDNLPAGTYFISIQDNVNGTDQCCVNQIEQVGTVNTVFSIVDVVMSDPTGNGLSDGALFVLT
ncbi:SprB repeat-containing protein, partial [Candidatus Dependentiae bacterium]|nr:SprB repeat-containing protein [Candidatus Dependentiae bacterium]